MDEGEHVDDLRFPVPIALPSWTVGSGAYNTTRVVEHDANDGAPDHIDGWTEVKGWVVERESRQAADAYDLQVLPSHTMYEFLAVQPEGTWLPMMLSDQDVGDRRVQRLGYAGEPAEGTDAAGRRAAEVALAECMDDLARLDTTEIGRWQAANIATWFDGPATWDAARRARLFDLWKEAYRRVPNLFGHRGPSLEQMWERLEPRLPPTAAVAPGRPVHNDGKYANVVRPPKPVLSDPKAHLMPDPFHKVIDWDLVARTYAAVEHAAVIDLVRLLHLTGRNPLVAGRGLWLPTAHAWAHAMPDARRAVENHGNNAGPIAAEALYQLALSGGIDTHRAVDGTVPVQYAVTAGDNLLRVLGFAPVGGDEHTARLTHAQRDAPRANIPGVEPAHGPPRRAAAHDEFAVLTNTAVRQTRSMQRIGAVWKELAQFLGADPQPRLATAKAAVEYLISQPPPVSAMTAWLMSDVSTQLLHLGERTAAALRDGVVSGTASLDAPAGWAALPRMPSQARSYVRAHWPTAAAPSPPSAGAGASNAASPAPSAGFAPPRRTARQAMEDHRANGECAWNPQPAGDRRQGLGRSLSRSLSRSMRLGR